MTRHFTNELAPELLPTMEQPPFTAEQLAGMNDQARALIAGQQEYCRQHPVTALYRIAVEGRLTREGGAVHTPWNGNQIELSDETKVNVALEDDDVVYADGRTAEIITGAGKGSEVNARSVAIVGSRLDNGDEVISTLCHGPVIVGREGETMPEDFLPSCEVA